MAQEKDDSIKLRLSFFDPFQANVLFLYPPPLKTSENLCFSDFFRGYRKETLA